MAFVDEELIFIFHFWKIIVILSFYSQKIIKFFSPTQ